MSNFPLAFFMQPLSFRLRHTTLKSLIIISLLLWGFFHPLAAQITVTNSVFPAVGDTLHYLFGNQPGAINQIFTPPGGNQMWDLSNLQPDQTWSQVMKNPQTGSAAASFPGASFMFNPVNSSSEVYWQVTGDQVKDLGYFGLDPLGLGLNLLFNKSPDLEVSWAPVNFFDIKQSSSNVLSAFDAPIAPAVLLNLVPTADSFRIRITYQQIGVIDAWGTLAIGPLMSALQNWLLSAVNNSGAVSPAMRATASRTPVMTPARAARSVIERMTFHLGVPSA